MSKVLLVSSGVAELRVAMIEDGRIERIAFERLLTNVDEPGTGGLVGAIFLGHVERVVPSMQAAFVDIGLERSGFLGAREARLPGEPAALIEASVNEGDALLVQMTKEAIGDKGARLSAALTLPGRLLVLGPLGGGVHVSRRIEDEAERARLMDIAKRIAADPAMIAGAGYVLRTNAAGADEAMLREDAERLCAIWRDIAQREESAEPPELLYRDLGPLERVLRDELSADMERVIFDDSKSLDAARAYCAKAVPALAGKLALYEGAEPMLEAHGVEDAIAGLMDTRVDLPSGGWITIESTEGMTAIDVNSGHYIDTRSLEDAALAINVEAAAEIARQLRLRGLGGLIVADFIDMKTQSSGAKLKEALAAAFAKDRAPVRFTGPSEFGLVEITRKRVKDPLATALTEICSCCHGRARIKTPEAVALDILREVERAGRAAPGRTIRVSAAQDVIEWCKGHKDALREGLAAKGITRMSWYAEAARSRESFSVETE